MSVSMCNPTVHKAIYFLKHFFQDNKVNSEFRWLAQFQKTELKSVTNFTYMHIMWQLFNWKYDVVHNTLQFIWPLIREAKLRLNHISISSTNILDLISLISSNLIGFNLILSRHLHDPKMTFYNEFFSDPTVYARIQN